MKTNTTNQQAMQNETETAAARRWLNRGERTKKERDAYIEGAFDAGISNSALREIEDLFFEFEEDSVVA